MRRPRAYRTKPGPPSDKPLRHVQRQKEIGLTEAHVQQTVTQFLELDGWRAIRTDPVSDRSRGKGFGEIGMPDYLYVRYAAHDMHYAKVENLPQVPHWIGPGEIMWCEFKAPGEKPDAHQLRWHEQERARGALVLVCDDIDRFIEYYKKSGLCRKMV